MPLSRQRFNSRVLAFLILVTCGADAPAQEGSSALLHYAARLFGEGSFESAICESHRAACFAGDSVESSEAFLLLGLSHRSLGHLEEAEAAFQEALAMAASQDQVSRAILCLASVYVASERPGLALALLLPLIHNPDALSARCDAALLSVIASVSDANWNEARSLLDERNAGTLSCMLDSAARAELRAMTEAAASAPITSPATARWLSTFIPGLGQLYAGDVKNGLHALGLNAANGWVIVLNIIKQDYVSAALFALGFAERYYAGNRFHAAEAAVQANTESKRAWKERIVRRIAAVQRFHGRLEQPGFSSPSSLCRTGAHR